MSEDSIQDKTEEPSGKRLADAGKQGKIARSRELNTVVMLLAAATLILKLGAGMGERLLDIMHYNFALSREAILDPTTLLVNLKRSCLDGAQLVAPLMMGLCLAAFIGPLAFGGWSFTLDAVTPKFNKLNPLKGVPRLFGTAGLVELLKALFKVVFVCAVAYVLFKRYLPAFAGLSGEPVHIAVVHALNIIARGFLILSASLILVALFDVPYAWWKHHNALKMSKQELRDEAKQSEGNPEIRQRIRRLQMEMSQGRMMSAVPTADVVVTNPTHFAVALKYHPTSSAAPVLVAKGVDLIAMQIRTVANEANVPIVVSPPLARALYFATELDQEIPKGLFLVVAQVFAYVVSLKTAQSRGQKPPLPPQDIVVPAAFQQS